MLAPKQQARLIQLLGMMGSAHDGEVVNAARLAIKLVRDAKMDWGSVLNGKPVNGGMSSRVDEAAIRTAYENGYRRGLAEGHSRPSSGYQPSGWRAFARTLKDDYEGELSEWEWNFVLSFLARGFDEPTDKQRAVFERISHKTGLATP